jgi:glycerol-3-phosphate dehydrogenase
MEPTIPQRDLSSLAARRHDVVIIGGGVNGAGVARDLALRGVAVLLVEQGDFGSGTSSASTKLIHGGLRYLERFDLHLVSEACRERQVLQRIAPHLVRPLPFFIPVYADDPHPLWMVRAGLSLYDLLALFRNTHFHHMLKPEAGLEAEPALREEGLLGVARYWDCRMDDARLCLENILAAREAGALVHNYLPVDGLLKCQGQVCGVRLVDSESGRLLEVEARIVVNAAGPWLDRVCALEGELSAKLRPTRGTHILVPRLNHGSEALYLTAGQDQRMFFVIPWGEGMSLIGTTDVDYSGNPDEVAPTEEDIAYLLAEAGRHLRGRPPERAEVVAAFAGLRPLVAEEAVKRTSRVSREHRIFVSPGGLLSIGGGKYTTYRAVAEEVSDRVCALLGRSRGRCLTAKVPLPGGTTGEFGAFLRRSLPDLVGRSGLTAATVTRLLNRYGSRAVRLVEMLQREPELAAPLAPGSALLAVEAAYACDQELARTPEDVLRRRTPLALGRGRGLAELEGVANLLAARLGRGERRQAWIDDYRRQYAHC